MPKATAKLGGVPLAANSAIQWRLQTGTAPYRTVMQVHSSEWSKLAKGLGQPLTLEFVDSAGVKQSIMEVYPLHTMPSDSPNRVSFMVADRRWKWNRILVSRDYNVSRRTGDRTILNPNVPVATQVVIDKYDFKAYSLKTGETKWTAREIIEDVLTVLTDDEDIKWFVESFPLADSSGDEGSHSIQNLILRDRGDVALARAVSLIPGTAIYVTTTGQIRVIDAADLKAGEKHLDSLPPNTWRGDDPAKVDRKGIRPSAINVHYQREVELLLEYKDSFTTAPPPKKKDPFLVNVIPTVDPETEIEVWQPDEGSYKTVKVPAGTWVEVNKWLEAMEKDKPSGSWPWTFDVIKRHWLAGSLEGVWGTGATRGIPDDVATANIALRVQAFRANFRQTFRINQLYTDRIRSYQEVRVAPLDPITGARAPAAVWGQATIKPSNKGILVASRGDAARTGVWILVDNVPEDGKNVLGQPPSSASVSFIDRDQGIFRVNWLASPYGTEGVIVPCHTTNISGSNAVPQRHLFEQHDFGIMGAGMRREAGTNEPFLANEMKLKVLLTIVPGAPNNRAQYHVENVTAEDVSELFRAEFGIKGGSGPEMDVFVPPGEAAARFAWQDDALAKQTIRIMLGLDFDDPNAAGLPKGTRKLSGFLWQNEQREVPAHAKAVAAEALAPFADNLMGRIATRLPQKALRLTGNISAATIRLTAAPSAVMDATHEFPGQQLPIDREALLPNSTRMLTLGIINGVRPDE